MNTDKPLIVVADVAALPAEQTLIVDCRFDLSDPDQGRRDYLAGHIPGAVYADLDHDLSDLGRQAEGLGRHPLPREQDFAAVLQRWGWHPQLTVIAYDAGVSALAAARLWWLLRLVGASARVLDGGLAAWTAAGLALQPGEVQRAPRDVVVHFDDTQVLSSEDVRRDLHRPELTVLDARAAPRYRGDTEPLDRVAGHVPGALNRPFMDNLQADQRFKPSATLRQDFEAVLAGRDPATVAHMCGSGVTACHNLLAMEQAGLHGSRLYAPSWSGWISDPARPVAAGTEP